MVAVVEYAVGRLAAWLVGRISLLQCEGEMKERIIRKLFCNALAMSQIGNANVLPTYMTPRQQYPC